MNIYYHIIFSQLELGGILICQTLCPPAEKNARKCTCTGIHCKLRTCWMLIGLTMARQLTITTQCENKCVMKLTQDKDWNKFELKDIYKDIYESSFNN